MAHLTNPLAAVDQLYHRFDALPPDLQDAVFFATQRLTQAAGLLLRLPQSVTAQANVLLARYWLSEPTLDAEFSDLSAAALFLTAKLGSHPCQPRDICNVYAYLVSPSSALFQPSPPPASPPPNDPSSYYLSEPAYGRSHATILDLESRILHALSFDTHVALPHPLAITYLQALDFLSLPSSSPTSSSSPPSKNNNNKTTVSQRVIAILNTALLSPQLLYLTHQPHALAVAAIYSAARDLGARTPACPWWEVFDVDREELGFLVVAMRSVESWARGEAQSRLLAAVQGMITRKDVEAILRSRGKSVVGEANGNGSGDGNGEPRQLDEEEQMMRRMDERAEQMEV